MLATNFATNALYAHPHEIVDARAAADGLAEIFPEMDADTLHTRFNLGTPFLWLRRYLSPEQEQQVHDLGEPGGCCSARARMRLYPNGPIAAHVLGGAGFRAGGGERRRGDRRGGRRGDVSTRNCAIRGQIAPLMLSLDLTVQATVEEVLAGGMALMNASGASAVMLDVHTGEIIAMVSLPDFDPNARPRPALEGDPGRQPAVQPARCRASTNWAACSKAFTVAQALDLDAVQSTDDMIDTRGPMAHGRVRDHRLSQPRVVAIGA